RLRDGPLLQRVAACVREARSRTDPGSRAGVDRAGVRDRPAAPRVVRHVDGQLRRDVPAARRRHRVRGGERPPRCAAEHALRDGGGPIAVIVTAADVALFATIWVALACFVAGQEGQRRAVFTGRTLAWAWPFWCAGALLSALHMMLALDLRYGWDHAQAV